TTPAAVVPAGQPPCVGYPARMAWRWAVGVTGVLVLVGSPGCSDRACVTVPADGSACPNRSEALVKMTPQCGASVISADSEGERMASDLCCYDVPQRNLGGDEPPCAGGRPNPTTAGVTVTSVGVGVGAGSSSSSAASSSSSGTGGAGGATCDADG